MQPVPQVLRPAETLGSPDESARGKRRFRLGAMWVLLPPLVWSIPGGPSFVTVRTHSPLLPHAATAGRLQVRLRWLHRLQLTVVVNAANVVALPFLTACIWCLTSRTSIIGADYANRWWEHGTLGGLFLLAMWAAAQSLASIMSVLY